MLRDRRERPVMLTRNQVKLSLIEIIKERKGLHGINKNLYKYLKHLGMIRPQIISSEIRGARNNKGFI